MDVLYQVVIGPLKDIGSNPAFFGEVVIGGILAGMLYSLVALGFVLIFKASGVFNFAQGVMVLFAALTLVGLPNLIVSTMMSCVSPDAKSTLKPTPPRLGTFSNSISARFIERLLLWTSNVRPSIVRSRD